MYLHSNVRILELRYALSFLLDKHTHISPDALQEAIQRGVARAEPVPDGRASSAFATHQIG